MKKLLLFLIATLGCVLLNAQTTYYYYYEGEKQYLELNTGYAFLSLKDTKLPVGIEQNEINATVLQSDKSGQKQYQMRKGTSRFWTELSFREKLSKEQYLKKLSDIKRQNKEVIVSPYFKINENDKIGLSNFFYVKLKTDKDTTLLRQIAKKTKSIVIEQDTFMPLWFVLSTTEASEMNALECSNVFYESGLFLTAEPDLVVDILACAHDTYFNNQWGLNNTGQYGGTNGIDINTCDAWQISTGENVTVAVIDEGIDLRHPDLAGNIHPLSFDCENRTSPSIVRGNHGTACAGIIGAVQNNSAGISGVAPGCQLMSISRFLAIQPLVRQDLAAGINWAWQNGADVISNSWAHNALQGRFITDAINNAITQGRGGKGCVVVFCTQNWNSAVAYPATLSDVIAVGAVSPCGERKSPSSCDGENWGSNYGTALDVVAPGVLVPTTDIQGSEGYNPNLHIHTASGGNKITSDYANQDYTVWFNGTSAATPHVAGIAALVLSVNPNLTGQQVRDIIESTAQKVRTDLYTYSTTPEHPNGIWHEEMGYGLVDAYAAVQAAQCYSGLPIVQGAILQNTTWSTSKYAIDTLTIPNGITLTITSEVKFGNNAGIVINPGGKLVVNGGILTNACPDKLWKGIIIEGTTTTPQSEQTQGSVILTNATIENALVAVNAALVKGGSNGGIIRATGTNFINNVQAIDYGPYENKDLNGAVIDNMGAFTQCTFSIDGNNYFVVNGQTFEQHVKLNRVRGIKFYGCTFNSETDLGGKGIYTMNAGFTVREHCTVNVPNNCPCPENAKTPSLFSHLTCGIHAENAGNPYLININQSVFDHNIGSVSINTSSNYSITRNRFSNILLYGVSSTASSGYRIEENYFTGAPGTARPTAGIRMNNSGAAENRI